MSSKFITLNLFAFQIFCKKNLPGVGENLQSHFGIGGIDFLVTRDGMYGPTKNLKNPIYKKQYANKRIGE